MTTVWICEKPSQARDIAAVLGEESGAKIEGAIRTRAGIVTWASGHLLEQWQPEKYNPALERWTLDALPIVPDAWRNSVVPSRAPQLRVICDLVKSASQVVIATDADREGEAIGREILDHAKYRGPIKRLWLSALDPESVKRAVASLREGSATAPLYWAAQARSRADWLVGMNLTRAATVIAKTAGAQGVRSVGRVQTPTLALVVRRDAEIESFVSRDYFEIEADVNASGTSVVLRHAPDGDERIFDRAVAEQRAQQVIGATGPLNVAVERKRQAPPPLFSLKTLQKACNKRFGFGADKTLEVAQSLYETHKVLSYPRSDCGYMPNEQEADIPKILAHLARVDGIGKSAVMAAGAPVVRKSVWNSTKITAHHAIVPTLTPVQLPSLTHDERRVYLMVAQQYVASLSPDYIYDHTHVTMLANGVELSATHNAPVSRGWKDVIYADDDEAPTASLAGLVDGVDGRVMTARIEGKATEPPPRYTEGTLLEDMSAIAKFCTDARIKARLKETSGIGTPATQANIIKTLRERGFIAPLARNSISSTPAGRALIAFLPPQISDPALTALWEDRLSEMAEGHLPETSRDEFVDRAVQQVRSLLAALAAAPPPDMSGDAGSGGRQARGADRGRGAAAGRSGPSRTSSRSDGVPTPKMLAYADAIAKSKGLKTPPASIKGSFDACKKWIDEHGAEMAQQRESGKPSQKQLELAQKIANKMGLLLPNACYSSRDECSRFLDTHSTNAGRGHPGRAHP